MRTIQGHFDGTVVILDEPAPVDHAVMVKVEFPEPETASAENKRVFHWNRRAPGDTYEGSLADEVVRQRRME